MEITYSVHNSQYIQIAGHIRRSQVNSSDGFISYNSSIPSHQSFTDLNDNYLDGVSISTKEQCVWSFVAGCNGHNTAKMHSIIG